VKVEDVPEIVESHLVNGVPVERLRHREIEAPPPPKPG
jgi:(2Fe-2S) ferredoxin